MFKAVKLYTQDGGFVVEGEIPTFNTPPGIIVWGLRFFQYTATVGGGDDPDHYVYTEAFTVALVRTLS
jgi:hypothetical protein